MDLQHRFVAGDLEAFEQLFRDHQRQAYAWIMRIVRNSAAAEDLTVETFWRIYRSRTHFRPDGTISAKRVVKSSSPTTCSLRPRRIPSSRAKHAIVFAPPSPISRRNIASWRR